MGSYTPNLGLYKPDTGETDWGDKVNANFDTLDEEVSQNSLDIADILNNKLPPLQTDVAYNKTQISKIKKEMLTIALNVMMNKALLNAETKDFYSIIADVVAPGYPNGFKNTLILPVTGVTFDNDGGGQWTEAIKISLTTIPSEYAVYKIVIQSNTMQIYAADGTLKAEYGAQTGVAADFWDDVKSDGLDIRVADQSYEQLYFWVEQFDYANSYAVIWVKVEAGTSELYIAYGNPSAAKSDYEDGEQVFEFFDDFEGDSLDTDKWTIVGSPTISIANGIMTITTAARGEGLKSVLEHGKYVIEAKIKWISGTYSEFGVATCYQDQDNFYSTMSSKYNDAFRIQKTIDGASYEMVSTSYAVVTNRWMTLRFIVIDLGSGQFKAILDDEADNHLELSATNTELTAGAIGLAVVSAASETHEVDWFFVAKLADPADFGTAETITLTTTGDFTTVTFDFPEGVDKLLITVDMDATAIYYSTDGGQTWNLIQPDTETLLPETAYSVKWKFEFASYVRGYAFITW